MTNPYYNGGSFPATGAPATSASMRAELTSISGGFDKLPTLSGNANKMVVVNGSASALEATGTLPALTIVDSNLVVEDNADSTRKFRFEANSVTAGATRVLTVPDANTTLVGTDAVQTLTNKTINLTSNLFTATSAQLAAAVTDETGSGSLVFGTNPTIGGATLTGGSLNNTPIGGTTPSTGAFTTLAASSTVTLSGGTANGVLYLNGSKVATSGSALTFDGTNLTVSNAGAQGFEVRPNSGDYSGGINLFSYNRSTSAWAPMGQFASYFAWQVSASEQMRLTSTGLGIGTSSPAAKLHVSGTGSQEIRISTLTSGSPSVSLRAEGVNGGSITYDRATSLLQFDNGGTTAVYLNTSGNLGIGTSSPAYKLDVSGQIRAAAASSNAQLRLERTGTGAGSGWLGANDTASLLVLDSSFTELMRVSTSGNLGLGVTPSAWAANNQAFEGPFGALSVGTGLGTTLTANAYYGSGAWRYKINSPARALVMDSNSFQFYTAGTGTAGNAISFTQAMTLDASGQLQVGGTTAFASAGGRGNISINGSGGAILGLGVSNTVRGYLFADATHAELDAQSGYLQFNAGSTERARITSVGDLLVGTQSGNERLRVFATNNAAGLVNTTAASATAFCWNQATSGNNLFLDFGTEAAFTSRGSINYNRAGGLVAYNTTSDYRAKDIIGPVQNVGATIDALKVYEGVMKGATQSRPMLIAHEAQQHAPYAVSGVKDEVNEDGTPKFQQMDVSSLVPLLLAEIQSLRARVAALETH